MYEHNQIRELLLSEEFTTYYEALTPNGKKKFDYVLNIMRTERVLSTKFVKKLENSDFYEIRVSVNSNEHRSIVFSIDNDNIINATRILLLNAFMKKSNNDYKKNITIAERILHKYL